MSSAEQMIETARKVASIGTFSVDRTLHQRHEVTIAVDEETMQYLAALQRRFGQCQSNVVQAAIAALYIESSILEDTSGSN